MIEPQARHETVMDPAEISLAETCAEAFLALFEDDDSAGRAGEELDELARLVREIEGFEDLLMSSALGRQRGRKLVREIFSGRVSPAVENLLSALAEHGQLAMISGVAAEFRRALDRRQGRLDVTISTAVATSDSQRQRLRAELGRALGAEPMLHTRVNPRIIGGLVVRVGDQVYDASVAARLRQIREALLHRAQSLKASQ